MRRILPLGCLLVVALAPACDSGDTDITDSTGGTAPVGGTPVVGGGGGSDGDGGQGGTPSTGGMGGTPVVGGSGGEGGSGGSGPVCDDGTPAECGAIWEENASDQLDMLVGGPQAQLEAFLAAVPKGGDLHNHLSGAVYAETYLDWAETENFCINSTTFAATASSSCGGTTQDVPTSGSFYDNIIGAWSMEGFVPGVETGHDHFFATFGKYGAIAGAHRFDSIADVATRAATENQIYVETMFNMGQNIGTLTDDNWVGTLNIGDLQAAYDLAVNDPTFAAELQQDVNVVNQARTGYRTALGCDGASPPAACDVDVRFTAQVSRLSSRATIFGQLIGAFEMATQTDAIVGVNLSSPEDEVSAAGYDLQMAMLDFLYQQYTATGISPVRVTLHAGELTETYGTPVALQGNIRKAVEVAHAERIGHGLSLMSDPDPQGLLDDMRDQGVLVEVCLSSNTQILEVSGTDHPLASYLDNDVPVALATDDQGVSRSSMAGEYLRAVLDQGLNYRQLKLIARNSIEHAFVPGDSLWLTIGTAEPVSACAPTDTMGVGDPPNATCAAFLATSERATLQWKLEHNFREFESQQ